MSEIFFTDPSGASTAAELLQYVEHLDQTISGVQWKQQKLLGYNYSPLEDIVQKIKLTKAHYLQKIQEEENRCAQSLTADNVNTQLRLFREFKVRLMDKISAYNNQLSTINSKILLLTAQAEQKRAAIKEMMREDKEIYIQNLTLQTHRSRITRSISTKELSDKQYAKPSLTTRKSSLSSLIFRPISIEKGSLNSLYKDCASLTVAAFRQMRSSDDVQSGLYLELIKKRSQSMQVLPKLTPKSTIAQTLLRNFQTKRKEEQSDYKVSEEEFLAMNWKQVLAILMVKDPTDSLVMNLVKTNVKKRSASYASIKFG